MRSCHHEENISNHQVIFNNYIYFNQNNVRNNVKCVSFGSIFAFFCSGRNIIRRETTEEEEANIENLIRSTQSSILDTRLNLNSKT